MKYSSLLACMAVAIMAGSSHAATISLIDGGLGAGNGDFNYEGGAVATPGTLAITEVIPRDRALVSSGTTGQGIDIDGWSFRRVAYSGANSAFGLDGHFGFDDASFEATNTGSGQAFTNGNSNTLVDLSATTINYAGISGDVIDLAYLLGSDSDSGNAEVTLTLDAGLGSEQTTTFALQTRSGTARDGSTAVTEQYISTGSFSTVDLTLQIGPAAGTRSLVDDVRLTVETVPEPGTLALVLMGLVSLGAVRMRRR